MRCSLPSVVSDYSVPFPRLPSIMRGFPSRVKRLRGSRWAREVLLAAIRSAP